ncbi:MAG: helix-turn-helix transcriptional regulator [Tepidisphaeraceae bacterium]
MPDREQTAEHRRFGRAVRHCRIDRDLSQTALAKATGFNPRYISALELGKINPTLTVVLRLRDGLGIPLSQLWAVAEGLPLATDGRVAHGNAKRRRRERGSQ